MEKIKTGRGTLADDAADCNLQPFTFTFLRYDIHLKGARLSIVTRNASLWEIEMN